MKTTWKYHKSLRIFIGTVILTVVDVPSFHYNLQFIHDLLGSIILLGSCCHQFNLHIYFHLASLQ